MPQRVYRAKGSFEAALIRPKSQLHKTEGGRHYFGRDRIFSLRKGINLVHFFELASTSEYNLMERRLSGEARLTYSWTRSGLKYFHLL